MNIKYSGVQVYKYEPAGGPKSQIYDSIKYLIEIWYASICSSKQKQHS